jgi:DNA-binding MarR family transcriptional regulator
MSIINEVNYTGVMKRTPDCGEAWQLLLQLFFSQRVQMPSLAAELDLSPAQCHLLHLIEPGQTVPMGQLAETLACDASNVTGLVTRLEQRGLVRRKPSATDRRVRVLELTAHGVRLRAMLVERITTPPPALERLSAQEHQLLVRILTRLVE